MNGHTENTQEAFRKRTFPKNRRARRRATRRASVERQAHPPVHPKRTAPNSRPGLSWRPLEGTRAARRGHPRTTRSMTTRLSAPTGQAGRLGGREDPRRFGCGGRRARCERQDPRAPGARGAGTGQQRRHRRSRHAAVAAALPSPPCRRRRRQARPPAVPVQAAAPRRRVYSVRSSCEVTGATSGEPG